MKGSEPIPKTCVCKCRRTTQKKLTWLSCTMKANTKRQKCSDKQTKATKIQVFQMKRSKNIQRRTPSTANTTSTRQSPAKPSDGRETTGTTWGWTSLTWACSGGYANVRSSTEMGGQVVYFGSLSGRAFTHESKWLSALWRGCRWVID